MSDNEMDPSLYENNKEMGLNLYRNIGSQLIWE